MEIKGEMPTENKCQIQRNQEVENKWKTKMKMDEQNILQNLKAKKLPQHQKTIYHFENESCLYLKNHII